MRQTMVCVYVTVRNASDAPPYIELKNPWSALNAFGLDCIRPGLHSAWMHSALIAFGLDAFGRRMRLGPGPPGASDRRLFGQAE